MDGKRLYFLFLLLIGVAITVAHLRNQRERESELVVQEIEQVYSELLPDKAPVLPEEVEKTEEAIVDSRPLKPPPDFLYEAISDSEQKGVFQKLSDLSETRK
ncbi:MAG: hypothetical protein HQM10_21035 [Candidatus Riflebacteria bacterium]|nr:hypothetical protein [Candidatus Riflebacteria bacterium]